MAKRRIIDSSSKFKHRLYKFNWLVGDHADWLVGDPSDWLVGDPSDWHDGDHADWLVGDHSDWLVGDHSDWQLLIDWLNRLPPERMYFPGTQQCKSFHLFRTVARIIAPLISACADINQSETGPNHSMSGLGHEVPILVYYMTRGSRIPIQLFWYIICM